MKGVVCNVPIEDEDVSSLLPRAADSNGIVIVKLKRKLEYLGHMYFEPVRPQFIFDLLNYLRQHNNLYTDITINTENISNNMSTLTDPNNDLDELIQELIYSINTPISIVLEKQHSELEFTENPLGQFRTPANETCLISKSPLQDNECLNVAPGEGKKNKIYTF